MTVTANEINLISKWFVMIDRSVWWRTGCVSILSGNGVKIEFGGNALQLGSVRMLKHRDGHWSGSMKSFAAMPSRTSNHFVL